MGHETQNSILDEAQQSVALMKLIEDFSKLNELLAACFDDPKTMEYIKKAQIELLAFKEILRRDLEYSKDQIKALCESLQRITDRLRSLPTPEQALLKLDERLTTFNKGKSPIEEASISIKLSSSFKNKMETIEKQCDVIKKSMESLRTHSKGRHHNLIDRLTKVCESVVIAAQSFFAATCRLANDAQYFGKRLAIAVGIREETLADKTEYDSAQVKYWQMRQAEHQQQAADQASGQKARMQAEKAKKPKIFK
ncbi:hypothetical protein CC99x_012790 [Candidatus Berkiella cookevillensis]|uniref:Uncharacterized protein n=1 Tax=Candidatus Berkiella cookevillensis TaxID=437022 RepID=A0A0Q9YN48_9GAMM|nr:hypothetical protein [Candidatus Berkiella cookevillensis]MCS5709776.1 hypothetical protein [Candidatus Berkiella cookevillensis]